MLTGFEAVETNCGGNARLQPVSPPPRSWCPAVLRNFSSHSNKPQDGPRHRLQPKRQGCSELLFIPHRSPLKPAILIPPSLLTSPGCGPRGPGNEESRTARVGGSTGAACCRGRAPAPAAAQRAAAAAQHLRVSGSVPSMFLSRASLSPPPSLSKKNQFKKHPQVKI